MIAVEKGGGSAKLVGKSLDAAMRDCSSACIAALRKVGRMYLVDVAWLISAFSLSSHKVYAAGQGATV